MIDGHSNSCTRVAAYLIPIAIGNLTFDCYLINDNEYLNHNLDL